MHKTLLKLLIYEVLERIARFQARLQDLSQGSDAVAPALFTALAEQADGLKDTILSEKAFLNLLFSEKSIKEKDWGQKLETLVYEPYGQLCRLSQLLHTLGAGETLPETQFFLKDALHPSLVKPLSTVLMTPETTGPEAPLEALAEVLPAEVLVESLSLLQQGNPLAWAGLTQATAASLCQRLTPLTSLKTPPGKPLGDLMKHLVSLRLLGPAYYHHTVMEALLRRDTGFLLQVEPALFYGLNHLNLTDKSVVIFHEVVEKARELLPPLAKPLEEETLAAALRAVEKAIPSKAAFEEKRLQRALQLQERLGQQILLSGYNPHTLDEIRDVLETRTGEAPVGSIYDVIALVSETPNTPREIVNAGWIHKLERSPVWLYSVVAGDTVEADAAGDAFQRLTDLVQRQDHLLVKSIETSEIHRVLLCTA